MGMTENSNKSPKNMKIYAKTKALFEKYERFLIVDLTKIANFQLQFIKFQLKDKAEFLFGKNTTVAYILREMKLDNIAKRCVGNIAVLFTNESFSEIREVMDLNKREAHAKVGDVSQLDLWLEPYNTGMGPAMTEFFQALEMQTKIEKGTVALIQRSQILFEGKKVLPSQANLLKFLDKKPFTYEMKVLEVHEKGQFFNADYLYISEEERQQTLEKEVGALAAISLELGLVNKATVPHQIMKGFNSSLCLGLGLGIELDKLNL